MKYSLIFISLMFIGCASERGTRTVNQILTPDKMNMQLHVNPDIDNDSRTSTEIQQVRLGLDWNL
jgi:hypothetical protein